MDFLVRYAAAIRPQNAARAAEFRLCGGMPDKRESADNVGVWKYLGSQSLNAPYRLFYRNNDFRSSLCLFEFPQCWPLQRWCLLRHVRQRRLSRSMRNRLTISMARRNVLRIRHKALWALLILDCHPVARPVWALGRMGWYVFRWCRVATTAVSQLEAEARSQAGHSASRLIGFWAKIKKNPALAHELRGRQC